MNTLKYTVKQLTTIIKQFTLTKTTFLKSNKLLISKQPLLALVLGKIDNIAIGVQKISKLTTQSQEATIIMSKLTNKSSPSSGTKKTQMIVQHDVAMRKVNIIITEIIAVMKLTLQFKQIQQALQSQSQSLQILTFYKQPLLLMLRVKFHLLTFLANMQKLLQQQQQLAINNIAIQSITRCIQSKSIFLLIYSAIMESQDQPIQLVGKTINEMDYTKEEYKSLLLRISAVFYQLLDNCQQSQPGNLALFFSFICSLITDKIETQKYTSSQYHTLQRKSQQKKGFFSIFKKQTNNKGLVNKSQTIQALKKKPKYLDSLQINSNDGNNSASQKIRQSGKGNFKKQPKGVKSNMKPYTQQDLALRKQFFLSKDQIQIVQFYLCSLLQKMFSQQNNNISPPLDDYKPLTDVLLNAYEMCMVQQVQDEDDKSFHDRIQEVLLKIIYKDPKLKHEDLLGQQSAYQLTISYQQLLNRVIAILGCLHMYLRVKFTTQKQPKHPQQIVQNSNLLLDFVVTLYQKIMMAHKCFIQTQISQVTDINNKHIPPSPSQNINSHRNLNKQTQKKFNLLYVMNTIAINIIGMLYRSPQSLLTEQQKVTQLNTLLTLHQIFLNQFNFPNYQIENQVLQSFRERPKKVVEKQKERQRERLNCNESLQMPIDMYGDYINSMQSLKKQLIKTHDAMYGQLKRLHTIHMSSIYRSNTKQSPTELSKSTNLNPTIRIQSPQQQKTPFQQYQQLIFSYQNITLQSLQQTANQLQQTFLNYYKKNKPYLYQQPQRMFDYFKKVSGHFFNYLSCLMMIVYKNNCKVEGRESFGIKNNVMTSLKLIKVLEKIVIFFWQLYWKFQDQFLLVNNNKLKLKSQQNEAPTLIQKQYTPMLGLIQQMNIDFFKLLQKFCFPRSSQKFDFRHMRSCLIVSSLLDIYKDRLEGFLQSQMRFVELRVRQSKILIKALLQIVQRASVSTASQQFQATNIQTKTKLTQNVIEKTTTIFTNPIINSHYLQTTMPQLIYNQHFNILVEIMFENYSQLKQKIDQENFAFIGEESLMLSIVKGIVRGNSERVLASGELSGEKDQKMMVGNINKNEKQKTVTLLLLRIDQSELQKLTVILQMYLQKQQYAIQSEKLTNNICLVEQINQIPLLAMELFQQIVDFVINVQLILPKSYGKVATIIYESKYFDLGFMAKMRENVVVVKKFVDKQLSEQKFTQNYHLQSYMTLYIQLYHKLMTTYMISFTSEKGNKISPTYLLQMGFEIFQSLLELNKLVKCISKDELVMLWRMKRSLTGKVRMVERGFKDVKLELLLLGNVLCVKDNVVAVNNNNGNNNSNKNQLHQIISQTLQNIYQKLSISAQKYRKNPRKSIKILTQMIQPFSIKSSTFFNYLFTIMEMIDDNQQAENILFPSEFMQLINDLFVEFSQGLRQYKKSTIDSLIGMDTPTFKMDEQKKKKDVIIMKKNKAISQSQGKKLNLSIKSLQQQQNDQQIECELQRNMARSIQQGNMQQSSFINNKNMKKNVIVSSLQFEYPQQESISNEQKQPSNSVSQQQSQQNDDEIVQQQHDQVRQSQQGSIVMLQLPSSQNSFQDVQKLNNDKLALIELFKAFYNNLFEQLEQWLTQQLQSSQSSHKISQQKDFQQVIEDLCTMVDRLQSGGIYKKQLLLQAESKQVEDQCVEVMKQCHLVVALGLRMLIIKYQQKQSQNQSQKLNNLLTTLEQSLTQIAINSQLKSIQNTIKQKKFKQKMIRLYRLSKQQFNKARTTIQKLTLNPRQSQGYFDEDDEIVQKNESDDIKQDNKKQQAVRQQQQSSQDIKILSQQFNQYIQFLEQLIQQMQRLSPTQIKQLFELKQSHLRQCLLLEYNKIISTPYHQQAIYMQLVMKMFGLIKTILIQKVWKVNEILGKSNQCKQGNSNSMMLYETIYRTVYPCLVEYIDLSKEIGSIVKDILKHNLVVVKEFQKKKGKAKQIQDQSLEKANIQEEELQ